MLRNVSEDEGAGRGDLGVVPTRFATRGPKTVPRVDWERIFVMNGTNDVLGEYTLNDECPLEEGDLLRSLPLSGLRHLVSFYQGEYAFTPFRVDGLWFVLLTHGVPRIEERGSIGTLLAAARIHIVPAVEPALAQRETEVREQEQRLREREDEVARREQRVAQAEATLEVAAGPREQDAELRT